MDGQTILVGVGQSDEERAGEVSRTAKKLARNPADRVVLAHVYDESDAERIEEMLGVNTEEENQLKHATRHNTAVRRVAKSIRAENIDLDFEGRFGEPGTVLVQLVVELEPDFLIVGGRKRSPAGKVVFGSTSQHVLLNADCPVVLVKTATE